MSRWARFLIAIAVGIGLGLLYGWVVSPVKYVDTIPNTLREDYKTDYVLMTAEAYHAGKDLPSAMLRLAQLGETPLDALVYRAILFGQKAGYANNDLALLQELNDALQADRMERGTTPGTLPSLTISPTQGGTP